MTLSALLVVAAAVSAAPSEFVIAERGTAAGVSIVLPEKPSPCLVNAADELSKYVMRMTGVRIPVTRDAAASPAVVLGRAADLPLDAFRISAKGTRLEISGGDDRGTLFGVYDFLERECGCTFLTADAEDIPKKDRLAVPATLDRVEKPAFKDRSLSCWDVMKSPDYAAKRKLNGHRMRDVWTAKHGGQTFAPFDALLGACHTLSLIIPTSKYYSTHPEYFALVDGKRKLAPRVQHCLTNPDVLKLTIDYVRRRIAAKYPAVKIYGVSQSDCWEYCTCPKCAAVDAEAGSQAGTWVQFVNAIAENVARDYPDVFIETLAYEFTRKPPKNLRLHPNVLVCICTDTCDMSKPFAKSKFRFRKENAFLDDLAKWCDATKHILIWDYPFNFRYMSHIFPNLTVLQPNLSAFHRLGVENVFEEGAMPARLQALEPLKEYLIAELLWNPERRSVPIIERFLAGYYHAAAPQMREYIDVIHRTSAARDEVKHPMMMWGTLTSPALPDELFERTADILDRAMAAAEGDAEATRHIQWEQNCNDFTRIMRLGQGAVDKMVAAGENATPYERELLKAAQRMAADWIRFPAAAHVSEETAIRNNTRDRIVRMATCDPSVRAMFRDRTNREKPTIVRDAITFRAAHDRYEDNYPGLPVVTNGALQLTLRSERCSVRRHPYSPPRPFPGPLAMFTLTDYVPPNGKLTLRIKDRQTKKIAEVTSRWNRETRFNFNLDPRREYQFDSIDFVTSGFKTNVTFRLKAMSTFFETTQAKGIEVIVNTGTPFSILDWPLAKSVDVRLRNVTRGPVMAKGKLKVSDGFGRGFSIPLDLLLEKGEERSYPLPATKGKIDAKGLWTVETELEGADGSAGGNSARFAVLDPHPVTPKIDDGRFRAGVHLHVMRHPAAERPLTLDAAVRMGAKIVRLDDCFSGWATWNRWTKVRHWEEADSMLEELEGRGLAVDAIVHENLGKGGDASFYEEIARRYGTRIDYYEVGNEWDLFGKETLTPRAAVDYQKMAYAALKKGCPKAKVTTNGWAVEDSNGHANVTQKGFQETFMREAKGSYDIHAMHLHFPFADYVRRLGNFFKLRESEGVTEPWILNETALSVQYRGEREVAENVWQKILYGWAKGARDYLWYNLVASQYDPSGVYGMMSIDRVPRLHYAAFSAFAAVFGGAEKIEELFDGENRRVYRVTRGSERILAGWDAAAVGPMPILVRTDAKRAWAADMMNNRRELAVKDGAVTWTLDASPAALVLEGATRAEADGESLARVATPTPRVITVERVRPDYGWDMRLHRYSQVHEEYPADPATAHRTWKGEEDCSGTLLFTIDASGRAKVRVSVRDEKDTPGDRVEIWRDGANVTESLKLVRTRHGDRRTTYEAPWPDKESCRVNVRFVDDDGFGGVDGWMDYEPFDAKSPDTRRWPLVHFR